MDREGHVVSRFSELIRPRVYKRLDKHIKQVTGITEQELAQGRPFSDVFGDFISWCGEDAQLVTWGRDDYPVLKRNAAFFMTPMPFDPPIDAQLVFGFCCLGGEHKQMNLHAAMEQMNVELDVAAHRAVNDAECTAALLPIVDGAVQALTPERLPAAGSHSGKGEPRCGLRAAFSAHAVYVSDGRAGGSAPDEPALSRLRQTHRI